MTYPPREKSIFYQLSCFLHLIILWRVKMNNRYLEASKPLIQILMMLVCFGVSGCGSSNERVVSVSGKVTRNNAPMQGLVVAFVPQQPSELGVSTGTTDAGGNYSLKLAKTGGSGAVVGQHKVWISLPRKPEMNKKKGGEIQENELAPDLQEILEKYGNQQMTPLLKEVKGDGPIDFQLD